MKKIIFTLVIISVFCGGASGLDKNTFTRYAGIGLAFPSSPNWLDDQWSTGYVLTGGFGLDIPYGFHVIGQIEYYSLPYDKDLFIEFRNISDSNGDLLDGGKYSALLIGIEIGRTFRQIGKHWNPYLRTGFGIASTDLSTLKYNDIIFLNKAEETKPYLSFTGGIEFSLRPKVSLYIQGRAVLILHDDEYSRISDQTIALTPFTVGVKF